MLETATNTGRPIDEPRSPAPRAGPDGPLSADGSASEGVEVARLLERGGVDLRSPLGAELLRLAVEQARQWADVGSQTEAPLDVRAAAVLGVRSAASQVLAWSQSVVGEGRDVTAAEDLCVRLAALAERPATPSAHPAGRRRWGEGAAPCHPQRPAPLSSLA